MCTKSRDFGFWASSPRWPQPAAAAQAAAATCAGPSQPASVFFYYFFSREDGEEQALPVLYVRSISTPYQTTVVPFRAEMPLWQYLRERAGMGGLSLDGTTVHDTFLSNTNSTGKPVVFNRANRLLRLGDVVRPNATLHHTGLGGGDCGNAAAA